MSKSMDWFLYDRNLRHESVNGANKVIKSTEEVQQANPVSLKKLVCGSKLLPGILSNLETIGINSKQTNSIYLFNRYSVEKNFKILKIFGFLFFNIIFSQILWDSTWDKIGLNCPRTYMTL